MLQAKDKRVFRVDHEEPSSFKWDYILLPYGEFYEKTSVVLSAKQGDILRFYNGRDAEIQAVRLIEDEVLCSTLCRMRYGIPWAAAFDRYVKYARFEGHSKNILVEGKCIFVAFKYICQENSK